MAMAGSAYEHSVPVSEIPTYDTTYEWKIENDGRHCCWKACRFCHQILSEYGTTHELARRALFQAETICGDAFGYKPPRWTVEEIVARFTKKV